MSEELLDARGVQIDPGDTVIYGFSVGSSVAMAEGVVVHNDGKVSLTPTGRVRVRVIRRSYSSGEEPVVSIMPDRLVALKFRFFTPGVLTTVLPASPLPTQAEAHRENLERYIRSYEDDLKATEVPGWWSQRGYGDLEKYHGFCRNLLAEYRRKLEALDGK